MSNDNTAADRSQLTPEAIEHARTLGRAYTPSAEQLAKLRAISATRLRPGAGQRPPT